ncbi:hypothetical protein [Paenibacillus paeoniae]|uniref:Uncharacterized protein n=1 Tax=Paenibacillus paeoniae TaxID=2292705 RepID=A0A371P8G7_9BACL|nr:hypothetical protein [Paenibacillus paeoniae]REK71800.1 hypothetical protein DX130_18950 [Paenibacillus paeoniae]
MNKMQRMLSILIAISLLLVACSGPSAEEKDAKAKELITEYSKTLMEVKDYRELDIQEDSFVIDQINRIKPYFSKAGFEARRTNDMMVLILAAEHQRNIELGEVELKSMEAESDRFDYEYRIPVRIKDEAGELLGEHEYQGQVKLVEENGRLIIEKEWSRPLKPRIW